MLTTSTHDTKRSEDVRNRLNVLSELPQLWSASVHRWQRMNCQIQAEDGRRPHRARITTKSTCSIKRSWARGRGRWKARQDRENYVERIKQYAFKALSEAKVNLSWINPDPEYMKAVHAFITAILMPGAAGKRKPVRRFARVRCCRSYGYLGQSIPSLRWCLRSPSPGVPDFYQGNELWELSLVDPDNRRPVDLRSARRLPRCVA